MNDAVFMGCMKDRVETVVLDDTLALAAEQERTVRRLLDQCGVGVAKLAQEPAEQRRVNRSKRAAVAKGRKEPLGRCTTALRDHGEDLMCQRREMERFCPRWLAPVLDQQIDHGNRAHQPQVKGVDGMRVCLGIRFDGVHA